MSTGPGPLAAIRKPVQEAQPWLAPTGFRVNTSLTEERIGEWWCETRHGGPAFGSAEQETHMWVVVKRTFEGGGGRRPALFGS
jgi:hypothetical protein